MLFWASVGSEGVEPFRMIQPEKVWVVVSTLLYHSVSPSIPTATTCSVFPESVTAGESSVEPEGRGLQSVHVVDAIVKIL